MFVFGFISCLMRELIGERVIVVGSTAAGKTTLARRLVDCLGYPHIEMDALHWDSDWMEAPDFVEKVDAATGGERWVMDGNYSKARSVAWSRADMIVWLDYPLWLLLWRVTWRSFGRSLRREVLWNGNRESLFKLFFTKNSMYYWVVKTYWRRKRDYAGLMAGALYPNVTWVRLGSVRETRVWFDGVCAGL